MASDFLIENECAGKKQDRFGDKVKEITRVKVTQEKKTLRTAALRPYKTSMSIASKVTSLARMRSIIAWKEQPSITGMDTIQRDNLRLSNNHPRS